MKLFRPSVLVLAAALVLACRPRPAVSDAPDRSDEIEAQKADAPPGSHAIANVEAIDGGGCGMLGVIGNYAGALRAVKNKAIDMGANYVKIVEVIEPHNVAGCYDKAFTIRGVAYAMPPGAVAPTADGGVAPSASVATPAAKPCDPPCSPGFACEASVCKAACNPTCNPGFVCNQARTCEPTRSP